MQRAETAGTLQAFAEVRAEKKTAARIQKLQEVAHNVRKSYRNRHNLASVNFRDVVVRLKKGSGRKELVRILYIGRRRTSMR